MFRLISLASTLLAVNGYYDDGTDACDDVTNINLNAAECLAEAILESSGDDCEDAQAMLSCYSSCCNEFKTVYEVWYPTCELECGCFPATGVVELADGSKKTMDEIALGDKVHVGEGSYSEVYFFSSEMKDATTSFVAIVAGDNELALTGSHYLYVNGELTQAGRVSVGDIVTLADGSNAKVSSVGSKWGPGLYNPHTMHGDIVVDGIKTSTYTSAVHPTLAHALLYPIRKLYEAGISFGENFATSAKHMPAAVRKLIRA